MEQPKTYVFTTVEGYKDYLYDVIDNKTVQQIYEGFTFAGETFSMGISAQINWTNLFFIPDGLYPLSISTKNEDVYELTLANRESFYGAALTVKKTALNNGSTLKSQVKECTTLQQLIDLAATINT